MVGFVYWFIDVGYAFQYHGAAWGLINIIFPVSLIWDIFMYLIKLIHGGIQ